MDCSLPGSSVHGIFQARIVEWVASSSPGDLPDPRMEPMSPAPQGDSLLLSCQGSHAGFHRPLCFPSSTPSLTSSLLSAHSPPVDRCPVLLWTGVQSPCAQVPSPSVHRCPVLLCTGVQSSCAQVFSPSSLPGLLCACPFHSPVKGVPPTHQAGGVSLSLSSS